MDEGYFVAGAAVAGAAEAVAGAVDFLAFFFDFFFEVVVEAVEAVVAVVAVAAAAAGAAAAGLAAAGAAVAGLAAAGLSSANAAPRDRTATATRAESVFFIYLPPFSPFICGRPGVCRRNPPAQPCCHGEPGRETREIKRFLRMV
jgi:hypothetical protein